MAKKVFRRECSFYRVQTWAKDAMEKDLGQCAFPMPACVDKRICYGDLYIEECDIGRQENTIPLTEQKEKEG